MSRKLQRSAWKDGQRRSPRICAMDAWKAQRPARASHNSVSAQNSTRTQAMEDDDSGSGEGPPARTRARKKIKLRTVEEVASKAKMDRESPNHEDHPLNRGHTTTVETKDCQVAYNGRASDVLSESWLPEKRILQLVLDILQRRDTYEIFAEPVDPNEVEDYYEIIKEPMDFGTMRAKLHEGMYRSLEQFEHDVFLISGNAMHFNSSATVYFRQARAIHELAKKIFHVLKNEPEKFELEFSTTRRRSGRRPQGDARVSNFSSCSKLARNIDSSNIAFDVPDKDMPCSLGSPLNLKRFVQSNPGYSGAAARVDVRDRETFYGTRDGKRSSFNTADRRCTYIPWMPVNEDNSMSSVYNSPKTLTQVDQKDISYRESLMLFAKDLGPTAQKIAKRKLQGWHAGYYENQTATSNFWFQAPKCQLPIASDATQLRPSILNTVTLTPRSCNSIEHLPGHATVLENNSNRIDTGDADKGAKAYHTNKPVLFGASIGEMIDNTTRNHHHAFADNEQTSDVVDVFGQFREQTVCESRKTQIQFGSSSSTPSAGKDASVQWIGSTRNAQTMLNTGKLDHHVQPSASASEHPASNTHIARKNNQSPAPNSCRVQTTELLSPSGPRTSTQNLDSQFPCRKNQDIAALGCEDGGSSLPEACQASKSVPPIPVLPQFIFNLPYLESRLNQMNSLEQDKMLQPSGKQNSGTESRFFDEMSQQLAFARARRTEATTQAFLHSQQQSTLGAQHANLALQL
ncbi:uncharacterized protein LOC131160515 [Malania oleifera]|uniref:uncharacterized protein LOC131160515 n=1 Tax=Malania oleifera TaxID=397392 RepID=UPI0025AE73AB|nr:uncharacterized protein LOC131160515 [Malania oleifera]